MEGDSVLILGIASETVFAVESTTLTRTSGAVLGKLLTDNLLS